MAISSLSTERLREMAMLAQTPGAVAMSRDSLIEALNLGGGLPESIESGGAPASAFPGVSAPSARYEAMLVRSMRYGHPRETLEADLRQAVSSGELPSGAKTGMAEAYLEQRYTRGYGAVTGTDPGQFMAPHMAQYYPEHQLKRFAGALPVSGLPEDPQSGRPVVPEGYFRRKGEAHVFPTSAITESGMLAGAPGGGVYTTWGADPLKDIKRIQLLGAHETGRMTGLQQAPAGPPEAQVARGALVVGGDVGGPGAGLIDPSMGYFTQVASKTIKPRIAEQLTSVAIKGATWGPGEQMVLGGGMEGQPTGKFSYRVTDVAATEAGGYRFTMERWAETEAARIRMASGSTKVAASVQPLGQRFTTPGGESLNLQFAAGLKDIQGAVEEFYNANPELRTQDIAQLGQASRPGMESMEAFQRFRMPSMLQTVHETQTMTAEAAQRFTGAGSLVSQRELGGGMVEATTRHQALVGTFAKQFSHLYPPGQVRLSAEEMENLQRADPQEHERIRLATVEERGGYKDLLNAMLASTGKYQQPYGTMAAGSVPLAGFFAQAQEAAGPGATQFTLTKQLIDKVAASEWGKNPLAISTPSGEMTIPPAATLQRHGAAGALESEETSALVHASRRLLSASLGGSEGTLAEAAGRYREAIRENISGGEVMRRMGAATVPGGVADVLRSSLALQPGEAYIPGRGGNLVQTLRFPSQGTRSYELQATSIPREEAIQRGINPEEFTASMELTQAMAGDVDGDLAYAWSLGKVRMGPGGQLLGPRGQQLQGATQILGAAKQARDEGAGDVWSEMSGTAGRAPSPEAAAGMIESMISGAKAQTPQQLEANLRAGQAMYERIGGTFNVLGRGPGATVSGMARGVYERIFNIGYGSAQRPSALPQGMEEVVGQLANFSLWSKSGLKQSGYAYTRESDSPEAIFGGVKGAPGLMMGTTSAFLKMQSAGGQAALSARDIALGMAGTEGAVPGIQAAVKAYRGAAPGSTAQARAYSGIIGAIGSPAEWQESYAGGMLMPMAVERAARAGATPEMAGLSPETFERGLELRAQQRARILAHSRAGSATEEGFLAKVEAYRGVHPGAGIVAQTRRVSTPAEEEQLQAWMAEQAKAPTTDPTIQRRMASFVGAGSGARAPSTLRGGGAAGEPPRAPPPVAEAMADPGDPGRPWTGPKGGAEQQVITQFQKFMGGMFGVGEKEFTSKLALLNENLDKWNAVVGPAAEGTEKFTKEMEPFTKRMVQLRNAVFRGVERDWGESTGRLAGQVALGRGLLASAAGQRLWQAEGQMGQGQIDRMVGDLGGEGGGGGLRGAIGRFGRPLDPIMGRMFSGWQLMQARRMWQLTGGRAFAAMQPAAAEAQQRTQMASLGLPMGQIEMAGPTSQLMRTQARQEQFTLQMGQAAQGAWGWFPEMMADTGLGQAAGWALPALGGGLLTGLGGSMMGLSATGVGIPVAAGLGLLGAARLGREQAGDPYLQAVRAAEAPTGLLGREMGGQEVYGNLSQAESDILNKYAINRSFTGAEIPQGDAALGERILSGELAGLDPGARAEAIGRAYQYAPEWMSQTAAQQQATEWMRYTPGATNIREIYEDPAFEAMAARGLSPEQFVGAAKQLGMGTDQWGAVRDLALSVPGAEFEAGMSRAGQWSFMQGFGMTPEDLATQAIRGRPTTRAARPSDPGMMTPGGRIPTTEPVGRLTPLQQTMGTQAGRVAEQARLLGLPVDIPEMTGENIEEVYGEVPYMQAQVGLAQQLTGMGVSRGGAAAATAVAGRYAGLQGIRATQGFMGGDQFTMNMLGMANVQGGMMDMGGGLQFDADAMKEGILGALKEFIPGDYFDNMKSLIEGIRPLTEPGTGLKMGTTQMWQGFGQEYLDSMAPDALERMGVTPEAWTRYQGVAEGGGRRGLRVEERALRTGYEDFQYQQAQERLQLSEVAQFGGSFTSPYGGGTLDTRGSFAIVKELRDLGRLWEDFSSDFSTQQRELGARQFRENWEVRRERMPTQFGWQREDLAFQGNQQALRFGWQMEDVQENLRFATGRERRRLLRQQERATVSFGMGQGRLETLGGRVDTRERWAEEDLSRQRRHFEERNRLQDDYQSRYRRYIEERRALEDELQQIREFQARFAIEAAEENLEKQRELQIELKAIAEWYNAINQQLEDAAAGQANIVTTISWLVAQFGEGGDVREAFKGFFSEVVGMAQEAQEQTALSVRSNRRYSR